MSKSIIIGITGSIAAYKACDIISRLKKEKFDATIVMTEEAGAFVKPLTFATLSQNKVYGDMFADPKNWNIAHVSLANKAKVLLVAPATANIIAKTACGIADDLLSCLILDTKATVIFAPAMNERMLLNPITQENIRKLKKLGYLFITPRKGRLACGETGQGCMAEVDTIIKEVKRRI